MIALDAIDRLIVNSLQGGFPLVERPFADAGARLGISEDELIVRVARLVHSGAASRFGPLWNAERLGGAVCLCAIAVPADRFEAVAAQVNAHAEVAHNYARDHRLNMWFVISTEHPERIAAVARQIEAETGLEVRLMPKEEEYFIGFEVRL
ncbi:MAG: AsnC family transcriptional regulator [Hyphomicrobiaceae bacterium]|nr:AsnC family transcriptional regulator [Hyphomicrobiaceae bacterium]